MTYQVLARKWRPRTFADLVGQEHVVRALVNALERGQLHHAYLFTGTRGVGKTTIARILAKTLNCEQGIGPTPCGVCSTCVEIDSGRYVDLIEVDAASRTKVDQTRDLLDNVPFAPVRGRFKVYLIDEVHMFSTSSFNALLKTLEEPPPHVKFVLATTDPQKLPATVLSRCLQFNLKRLLPTQIRGQFETVLRAEGVDFEAGALNLLARAADGSMRDGLSLLDQAIAFGAGRVGEADVRAMLGTRGGDLTLDLLAALAASDGARVLAEVARIAELTPDFAGVLADLIAMLHRLALAQQVPATLAIDDPDRERITALAARIPAEDVQLFYQIMLLGQADLPLAPDPRSGLEMVLLRALAFRPDDGETNTGADRAGAPGPAASAASETPATAAPTTARRSAGLVSGAAPPAATSAATHTPAPSSTSGPAAPAAELAGDSLEPKPRADSASARRPDEEPQRPSLTGPEDWYRLVQGMALTGLASQLVQHCAFRHWDGRRLCLHLDPSLRHLRAAAVEARLTEALSVALGGTVRLEIDASAPADASASARGTATPAARRAEDQARHRAAAADLLAADPAACELQQRFDADWLPDSIQAAD
ncbi:MAG: DNA polymerase III subunit gamma/tau [Chromatiaceae bacterium]|nr:MAG: DNA polymerase III subunit gamma/tau [Chromatiaceae bacterium]